MDQDEPVAGVVAHGLLNALTAIEGLIVTARSLVAPDAADAATIDELLGSAEARTKEVTAQLRQLVRGLAVVIDLDEAAAARPPVEPEIDT